MTDVEETREATSDEPDDAQPEAGAEPVLAEPEVEGEPPLRKRKKKRKKKRRKQPDAPRLRPALDSRGRDRPLFLLSFPHDPDLDRLIAAYEAGDYARVRRDAPELAERTDDLEVRDAALELRRRIDPDPLARYLLLTAISLLVFLVIWVYAAHR